MAFLYYVENQKTPVTLDQINEWQLGYAFDGSAPMSIQTGAINKAAPSGMVFADSARLGDYSIGYYPELQAWRRMTAANSDKLWIGYYNDKKPKPADLALRNPLTSMWVTRLGDGEMWAIPIVLHAMEECALDRPMMLVDDCWVEGCVKAKHKRLWLIVSDVAKAAIEQLPEDPTLQDLDITDNSLYGGALHILQKNYAIGADEVAILELFEPALVLHLWLCAADFTTYLDAMDKKKEVSPTSEQS